MALPTVIQPFLDEQGRVTQLPVRLGKRQEVLRYLALKFEENRSYTEKEVNAICQEWHTFGDFCILRRELVTGGFLQRERDGSRYWRAYEAEAREEEAGWSIPTTLKHKPVYVVENYEAVDGRNANHSEAKGLSLGLAQWNDRGKVDISAKIWRNNAGKWSRQSEEMPLHRVLDLTLLILAAKKQLAEAYRFPKQYDPENTLLERIPLQGSAMTARICTDNPRLDEDLGLFAQVMAEDDELISERLHRLSDTLRELGYGKSR
jgi:hypothetical protein